MMRTSVACGAACALFIWGCHGARQGSLERQVVGMTAPDFALQDLDGRLVRLSTYRGRPVVVVLLAFG